jgi:hypothetical protein
VGEADSPPNLKLRNIRAKQKGRNDMPMSKKDARRRAVRRQNTTKSDPTGKDAAAKWLAAHDRRETRRKRRRGERSQRKGNYGAFVARYPGNCWYCGEETEGTECAHGEDGVVVHTTPCLMAMDPAAKIYTNT